MTPRVAVFDAYGTLFDVTGALREAALAEPDAPWSREWPALAREWRRKQLEVTWLRAAAGRHAPFDRVTADALDWTLTLAGLPDPGLRARLLDLYARLPAYPDAREALEALAARGMTLAVLTNATPGMIAALLDASGLAPLFGAVLTAEEAGAFKPHPSVYALVPARFGCAPEEVLFVSANGWDAAGAAGAGFRAVRIDREGMPPEPLWAAPAHVVGALADLPGLA